ncbi:MAG TPA: copper resistance CopC family protein [Mycobacterium sp.]|nr:copper resistance CopC family protein [Mycobacterium sp.]
MLLAATLFAATGVAAAHAVLVSTDPAADTAVTTGPAQVSATFNERLQTTFAAMTVVGPDGHLWSTGDTRVDGPVASVAVRPLGPAGTYTVNYRVTSADGHVVAGSWPFRLTVPGTGQPGPPVAPGGSATLPDGAHGSAGPAGPAPEPDLPIWPFAVGAIVIVGAGLWLARPKS